MPLTDFIDWPFMPNAYVLLLWCNVSFTINIYISFSSYVHSASRFPSISLIILKKYTCEKKLLTCLLNARLD